jgi:hypothetical protein
VQIRKFNSVVRQTIVKGKMQTTQKLSAVVSCPGSLATTRCPRVCADTARGRAMKGHGFLPRLVPAI